MGAMRRKNPTRFRPKIPIVRQRHYRPVGQATLRIYQFLIAASFFENPTRGATPFFRRVLCPAQTFAAGEDFYVCPPLNLRHRRQFPARHRAAIAKNNLSTRKRNGISPEFCRHSGGDLQNKCAPACGLKNRSAYGKFFIKRVSLKILPSRKKNSAFVSNAELAKFVFNKRLSFSCPSRSSSAPLWAFRSPPPPPSRRRRLLPTRQACGSCRSACW